MALTWPHAAAALVVEVDRARQTASDVPARVGIANRTAKLYWTLGWRPTADERVPLAFNPWHALPTLAEEGIVEAALRYCLTAGLETVPAAGDGAADALADAYVVGEGDGYRSVWAVPGRPYSRRLARLGVSQRIGLYGGERVVGGMAAG